MNDTAVTTSEVTTETTTAEVPAKKKRGAKPNPESAASRSKVIMASMAPEELTRANVIKRLMAELNLSEAVASVYFYNYRSTVKAQSAQ